MNRKSLADYNLDELKKILDCKVTGIVRAIKPLAYDGKWNEYYGLKMGGSYILWLSGESIGNFFVEDFDKAEDFEDV